MKIPPHVKVLIALTAGVGVGLLVNWKLPEIQKFGSEHAAVGAVFEFIAAAVKAAGQVFVRSLRFIAVPIILCSLVASAASMSDFGKLRRIAFKTIGLFVVMTVVATVVGITIANTFRPGDYVSEGARDKILAATKVESEGRIKAAEGVTGIGDMLVQAVPVNPFDSLARGDMLQVVVASLALGIALAWLPRETSRPVLQFFEGLNSALHAIVTFIMWYAHWGVFALLVPVIAAAGWEALTALAAYCACVIGGLGVILLIEYPLMVRLLSPFGLGEFFRAILPAQTLAFSSSSSAATLPVTLKCVENLGVPKDAASLVCSLGTTINMDGTAIMQSVAAVFIAQVFGHDLSLYQQVTIVLTATMAAIGAPGIPSGGIVLLVAVLQSANIPVAGIGLVIAVDRFLDMSRTIVNVTGDAVVAAIVGGRASESSEAAEQQSSK
jgi:proton glutamate symport protein